MPQQVQDKQIGPIFVLKPNRKRVVLKNLMKIIAAILLIEAVIFIIQLQVGFGIFGEILGSFGITVSGKAIILVMMLSVLIVGFFLLLGVYLAAGNFRYEFYTDKMLAFENIMMIGIKSTEVAYENVARILYNASGLTGHGTITLHLSGTDRSKIELSFIDDAKQSAEKIQSLISRLRYVKQAEFTESYKINNILDKF